MFDDRAMLEDSRQNRRRFPRIYLGLSQVLCLADQRVYGVDDLSPQGMRFRLIESAHQRYFPVGSCHRALLKTALGKIEVQFKVVNLHGFGVGVEWVGSSHEFMVWWETFADPVRLAQHLRPSVNDHYDSSSKLILRSGLGLDLLISSNPVSLYIYLHQSCVFWEQSTRQWRTGRVLSEDDSFNLSLTIITRIVEWDQIADHLLIEQAKSIIQYLANGSLHAIDLGKFPQDIFMDSGVSF